MPEALTFDPTRPSGPRRPPADDSLSDLDRLLAHEEIRQLVARYAVAMDSRDLDCLASLFVEDYEAWSGRVGRDALREEFEAALRQGMGGRVGFTQIGTHVINLVDADHAHGTLYCTAEFGDADRWVRQTIAYEDAYERRDGVWYLAAREHHLFYGADLGLRPLDQPPAEWPKEIVGVGTAPYAWPTWRAFEDESSAGQDPP
jgi:ketosteroid isomerase-like protein